MRAVRVLAWLVLAVSAYGTVHPLLPWHEPLEHPTFTERLLGDRYVLPHEK